MTGLLYLVIDGAADRPERGFKTPLQEASKPGLDWLARHSVMGLHYSIAPGVAPESDSAVMSLLGYEPDKYYTGRGPLEALGAGIRIVEGREVAFRANFATIDEETLRIIDRRVGRSLETSEAKALAEALDGVELDGGRGYARVRATIGHRAVVVIGHREEELSDEVDNTDPAYERRGRISVAVSSPVMMLRRARPLAESPAARLTARLVNEFTEKAIEILRNHPVNLERAEKGLPKANAILLRDAGGRLPRLPSLEEKFGLRFAAITEMPVEKGIAIAAGMHAAEAGLEGSKRAILQSRLRDTLRLLGEYDAVYVHLKGPDEPGHDGDCKAKAREIELIDKYYVSPLLENLDLRQVAVLVTSDHATPCRLGSHSGDPVPLMLAHAGLKPDGLKRFDEETAAKGSLGVLEHGWLILPRVLAILRELG